jgi:UPF0755 protein
MARSNPYERRKKRAGILTWLLRLGILFVTVTGCLAAALLLATQWERAQRGAQILVEGGNPNLNPVERAYLASYLAVNREKLAEPVGAGNEPASFTIAPGEHANQIAANLAAAGLLHDTTLFANYLRYYGLDGRLEAGVFQLNPQLTIPELALTLTRAIAQEVELRFREGLRLEEVAADLAENQSAQIDAGDFLLLAQRRAPFDLSRYDFLGSLPVGATLEGFLFPDTYRVPLDADAAYLLDLMLSNFGRRVTPALRQSFGVQGLTVYEAVTLASIVEREAAVPSERPLMARVFLNRLDQGILLQADPTTQYALGYQADSGQWWKSPLFLADLGLDSPYNTYVYAGLPPGPIASPGLAALQAVADPADADYLFFVTDCTSPIPGAHVFSLTYEEHLAHVQRCR